MEDFHDGKLFRYSAMEKRAAYRGIAANQHMNWRLGVAVSAQGSE